MPAEIFHTTETKPFLSVVKLIFTLNKSRRKWNNNNACAKESNNHTILFSHKISQSSEIKNISILLKEYSFNLLILLKFCFITFFNYFLIKENFLIICIYHRQYMINAQMFLLLFL